LVDVDDLERIFSQRENDDRVVVAVIQKPVPARYLAVPAVLLNQGQIEGIEHVVVETLGERRVEKRCVVPEMIGVIHRNDATTSR
jgi:hypothetical protein